MQSTERRATSMMAGLLILFGIVLLAFNLFGLTLGQTWPVIFLIIAAGFYIPIFVFPTARPGLAALFIPGTIMLGLGVIFLFNTFSGDWGAWAYLWALIPASAGLGLVLAAKFGDWASPVASVGWWLILGSLALFALMGLLLGGRGFGAIGSILLIGLGVILLFRAIQRPRMEV
jgi:hypothetical protein